MKRSNKISEAELEIMRLLWKSKEPMTAPKIRELLQKQNNWEKSTIQTLIRRLLEKNAILCEKKEIFYYSPIITEQEYSNYHTQNIVDKIYNGNLKNYVLSLCDKNKLTKNDIQELKDYFNGGMDDE